jgi:hypothetical protein
MEEKPMKTTIIKTGRNTVALNGIDPVSGERVSRLFWVPTGGGYVREGALHNSSDPQVCAGLSRKGNCLFADDGDDLLRVIRREWRAYRRAAQRAAQQP